MSDLALLRAMLMKEIRTTFRERSQLRALVISVVAMCLATGGNLSRVFHTSHRNRPGISIVAHNPGWSPHSAEQWATLHWVEIGGAALVGFFFSMGYLISAILASFVGEREAKTLEVFLASPVSDRKLFVLKCLSVLLPSAGIGYLLAAMAATAAVMFVPADVIVLPMSAFFYALVLSVPVMLIPQLWFVALGAAVSVKAETMKGAAQVLSGVFMFIVFGGIYGAPLLLQQVPGLRGPIISGMQAWMSWSFVGQYASMLVLLAASAAVCMASGRAFFRRDRMLT